MPMCAMNCAPTNHLEGWRTKKGGLQGIPDQIVPDSSPTALSHTANDTAKLDNISATTLRVYCLAVSRDVRKCLALRAQAACKEKEGEEDQCALRYVMLTS